MKQTKEIITKNEMGTVVSKSALPCIPGDKVYLLWKNADIIPAIADEVRLCKGGQVRIVLSLMFSQLQNNSSATVYKSADDFGKSVFTNKSDAIQQVLLYVNSIPNLTNWKRTVFPIFSGAIVHINSLLEKGFVLSDVGVRLKP